MAVSHQHYQCIVDTCEPVNAEYNPACCTTDANGECMINILPGDYIVISADATKTVLPDPLGVSAGGLLCGEIMQKYLQQIVKSDAKKVPGKTFRRTGSELLVIEPEFVEWSGTDELYPFIFESEGDWTVTTSVTPPEDSSRTTTPSPRTCSTSSRRCMQFTITDIGSDWVPTEVQQIIEHNGRREHRFGKIGVRLTPGLAELKGVPSAGHPHPAHSAWLVGWITPMPGSASWTFKVDVYEQGELSLEVVKRQGRNLVPVALLAADLAEGEGHEFIWDATGITILPGRYFIRLTTTGSGMRECQQMRPLISL